MQESVENQREIINENFNSTISTLEYICDIELEEASSMPQENTENILSLVTNQDTSEQLELQAHQEEINFIFNKAFEIIDSIVPSVIISPASS